MDFGSQNRPVALTDETLVGALKRAQAALDANDVPSYDRKLYYYRDGKEVIYDCDTGKETIRDIPFL